MDTKALNYIRPVDPEDPKLKELLVKDDDDLYVGPVHSVGEKDQPGGTNTSSGSDHFFPSPSAVLNESRYQTGVYVADEETQAFDDEWRASLTRCFEQAKRRDQLDEFLTSGRSNGRRLRLQVMVLPPGMYFKIHAHPNIEFELTVKGNLEESRFAFCMPAQDLAPLPAADTNHTNPPLVGPNIRETDTLVHNQVKAGQCMINEVGSVHQSFTGTEGPCAILVLWSGCHANTRPDQVACTDCRLKPQAGW